MVLIFLNLFLLQNMVNEIYREALYKKVTSYPYTKGMLSVLQEELK